MKDINGNEIEVCQVCGQQRATISVKTNVNGVVTEKHLCKNCAGKLNEGKLISDLLNGANIMSALFNGSATPYRSTPRVCPKCGTTEREVRKNFRLGCSACYDAFKDIIDAAFEQMGGRPYKGRTPRDVSVAQSEPVKTEAPKPKIKPVDEVTALKSRISEAAAAQNYAEAARLQEQLKKLTGNI
ncbi:MAG: hypothetical protein K2M44_02955 [Clostridia bacterium]|nr:hypothetical protein [Clostridia bacterium]